MAKEDKNTNVAKGKPVGKMAGTDKRITPGSTIKLGRQSGGNPVVIVNDQADSSNGDSADNSNSGTGESTESDNK